MRKYLIAVLAGAALAACQQQPAPEPTATETADATTTASGSPTANAESDPSTADANVAAPCAGDDCPRPASGYDWAAAHNIDDAKDCTVGDQDFKDGCALYVQEKAIDEGEREFEGDGE